MMEMETDRARPLRKALAKAAFIFGGNLVVAALVLGPIALLTRADPFHPGGVSAGWAAFVGLLHLMFGATALALRASARFLGDAEEAEDLLRNGPALVLGGAALISAGASMVLLSIAGSNGPLSADAVLAGVLSLTVITMILAGIRFRLLDELNRAASREAGYLAFTWFSLIGGTWAILAHLGFADAPTPLIWLTLMWSFSFVAGLVALARKGGFDEIG